MGTKLPPVPRAAKHVKSTSGNVLDTSNDSIMVG